MWLFSWVMLHYVHWLVDNIIRVLFGSDQVGCSWFSFRLQLLIVVRWMQQRRTCESKTFCKDKLYHLKCLSLGFSLLLHFHRPPLLFPTPLPAPGWQLRQPCYSPACPEMRASRLIDSWSHQVQSTATGYKVSFPAFSLYFSIYPQTLPTLWLQANALFLSDCHFLLLLLFFFFLSIVCLFLCTVAKGGGKTGL